MDISVNGVNRFDFITNYFRYSRSSYHQCINEKIPLIGTSSIFIPNYVNSDLLEPEMKSSDCEKSCDRLNRPVVARWSGWRTIKEALLILVILFTLICFIFVKEKQEDFSVITIKQTEPKYINLTNELNIMSPVWTIRVKGPFIPPYLDNLTDFDVYFSIVKISKDGFKNLVRGPWSVPIAPVNSYTKVENIEVEHSFNMRPSDLLEGYDSAYDYQLKIATTQEDHTAFSIDISTYTELTFQGIFMSCIVLAFLYFLIIFDIVQRTLAAMIGATAAIACLSLINNRPSLEKVISWLDIETLALLFGMMVMVAILCETGFFDYIAVLAFRLARGKIWPLIIILCVLTALLSSFLDNVTTILLMTPVTIRLCEIKSIDPKHVLIAQVIFSNIGGAATPVGDPPNVIIIGNSKINSLGVNFTTFITHVMPCIIICIIVTIFLIKYLYKDVRKLTYQEYTDNMEHFAIFEYFKNDEDSYSSIDKRHEEKIIRSPSGDHSRSHYQENISGSIYNQFMQSNEILNDECLSHKSSIELRREIDVWKKACNSISGYSRDENSVRDILRKQVCSLENVLKSQLYSIKPEEDDFKADLSELARKYKIRNKPLLIKSGLVMGIVILLFFFQTLPHLDLSLGWIALLGAIAILILADFDELESIFGRVEWSTLIFFGALFVVMEALSELKLLLLIGQLTQDAINSVSQENRLIVAIMLVLWVSALASSLIDNIPFATVMVKIIEDLATNDSIKIPITPLVYALALGACLGGNGTLIGASANVVCAGVAEQHGCRFTFIDFFKIGFPVMLVTTVISSIYLIICHVILGWH